MLVGVWTEGTQADADRSLAELAALAETAGSEVLEAVSQRRDKPDAATYVGSGKATEIRDIVAATGADTVICDGELTPGQLNQLEKMLKVKVVDRTALILDIFAQHASSREGKAQVELAQMQYMLPRLRGWGESLSRQAGGRVAGGGGIGTRGPGETKIETDRRRIRARVSKLRREIAGMATARATQRSSRDRNAVPSVAIAGYTNAGKSSLLNALTGAGVLVENALFATLDPTVRRAESPDGREYTLTDTVGFVRHLPHQLVDAFRSTLEEVAAADLLLHVVDGSDPDPLGQIDAVRVVLGEIDAAAVPEVIVVNKVDAMTEDDILTLRRALPGAVWVSARTGAGIDALRELIAARLPHPDVDVDVLVPYDRGDLVARVHRDGEVLSEKHEESGTRLTARVDGALAATLEEFAAPRRAERSAAADPARPDHGQVTGRYGDAVTSGVVRDAGLPETSRVVSVGRPPVVGCCSSRCVVGCLVTARPAHPRLRWSGWTCGSPRSSATGSLRGLGRLSARLGRDPGRRAGDDPRRPRRAGRLPGLAAAHAGCRWCGCWSRWRLLTVGGLRDQARHRPDGARLPGFLLLPRRRRVVPVRARRQRRAHVGRGPLAGGGVRPAAAGAARVLVCCSVAGPVATGLAMVSLDFHWVTDAVVGAAVGVLLLGVVHALDAVVLSRWVRARAGRQSA